LVEGNDIKLLRYFQDRLYPESAEAFEAIPNTAIGGWGNWAYALGGSLLLQNSMGENIKIYCVLDSGCHTGEEIEGRYKDAREKGVQLYIWKKNEIENYLLAPKTISRLIGNLKISDCPGPTPEEVSRALDTICFEMKDEVLDAMATEILARNRSLGAGGANKQARELLKRRIESEGIAAVVRGKAAFSALSAWAQKHFGVSLTAGAVARSMAFEEIPQEIRMVVEAIEYSRDFVR
jgi:hypothetical protein